MTRYKINLSTERFHDLKQFNVDCTKEHLIYVLYIEIFIKKFDFDTITIFRHS